MKNKGSVQLGFVPSVSDTFLFVYKSGSSTAYLLLYIDDIVCFNNRADSDYYWPSSDFGFIIFRQEKKEFPS